MLRSIDYLLVRRRVRLSYGRRLVCNRIGIRHRMPYLALHRLEEEETTYKMTDIDSSEGMVVSRGHRSHRFCRKSTFTIFFADGRYRGESVPQVLQINGRNGRFFFLLVAIRSGRRVLMGGLDGRYVNLLRSVPTI